MVARPRPVDREQLVVRPPRSDVLISITPTGSIGSGISDRGALPSASRPRPRLEYRSLASKALVPEDEFELAACSPTGRSAPSHSIRHRSEVEFGEQLASFGGTEHRDVRRFSIPPTCGICRACWRSPETTRGTLFAVNLMRAHAWSAEGYARGGVAGPERVRIRSTRVLASCLEAAAGTNLSCASTPTEIAAEVAESAGMGISAWPMIGVGAAASSNFSWEPQAGRHFKAVRLVAPIQTQRGKGLSAVLLARRTDACQPAYDGRMSLAARFVAQPGGTAPAIVNGQIG